MKQTFVAFNSLHGAIVWKLFAYKGRVIWSGHTQQPLHGDLKQPSKPVGVNLMNAMINNYTELISVVLSSAQNSMTEYLWLGDIRDSRGMPTWRVKALVGLPPCSRPQALHKLPLILIKTTNGKAMAARKRESSNRSMKPLTAEMQNPKARCMAETSLQSVRDHIVAGADVITQV